MLLTCTAVSVDVTHMHCGVCPPQLLLQAAIQPHMNPPEGRWLPERQLFALLYIMHALPRPTATLLTRSNPQITALSASMVHGPVSSSGAQNPTCCGSIAAPYRFRRGLSTTS